MTTGARSSPTWWRGGVVSGTFSGLGGLAANQTPAQTPETQNRPLTYAARLQPTARHGNRNVASQGTRHHELDGLAVVHALRSTTNLLLLYSADLSRPSTKHVYEPNAEQRTA